MTDKQTMRDVSDSNAQKDPQDWVTGDERMTGAQHSYLHTLCEEAHEAFDPRLTKAQASLRIEELQRRTGRGQPSGPRESAAQRPTKRDEEGDPVPDELDVDGSRKG